MRKFITSMIFAGVAIVLPSVAGAVTLKHTLGTVSGIINAVIPILLAIAVIAFFWGLILYLLSGEVAEKKAQGIEIMMMGLIAIFVMVSIWGIIGILQSTFKVNKAKPIIPDVIERNYR